MLMYCERENDSIYWADITVLLMCLAHTIITDVRAVKMIKTLERLSLYCTYIHIYVVLRLNRRSLYMKILTLGSNGGRKHKHNT